MKLKALVIHCPKCDQVFDAFPIGRWSNDVGEATKCAVAMGREIDVREYPLTINPGMCPCEVENHNSKPRVLPFGHKGNLP